MSTTGFEPEPPNWRWPPEVRPIPRMGPSIPGTFEEEPIPPPGNAPKPEPEPAPQGPPKFGSKRRRQWLPRTCRICLDTVNPTFHTPSEHVYEILQPAPSVTYESPELGRLINPCKCKGSSKYVHEGCLQAWRHADPAYGTRHYWQCPTCGFQYRLERMAWGRWISSTATQVVLTTTIFILALFLMGFIADPIINLYVDPYGVFMSPSSIKTKIDPILTENDAPTWTEHFIKGLASLGLLSFIKVLTAMSPWSWWNMRSSGIIHAGRGSGNTGRDRMANISWVVVLIGIGTFLWAIYKGVRAWSRRTLEKAGERVMDVGGNDDNEDDDEE